VLVKEVMSPATVKAAAVPLPSVFVYADATTRDAAEIMATEGLEAVPVADRKTGQVCGVLSIRDLLQVRGRSRERENERLRLFWHVPPEIGDHH
jgi:CIC family chloride channel protein